MQAKEEPNRQNIAKSSTQKEIKFFNINQSPKQRETTSPQYDSSPSDNEMNPVRGGTSGADETNLFQTMPFNKNKYLASGTNRPQKTQLIPSQSTNYLDWTNSRSTTAKKPPNGHGTIRNESLIQVKAGGDQYQMRPSQSSPKPAVRSSSAQNLIRVIPRGVEDLKHSLHRLKIDYNQVQDDNVRLKTRNAQLENLVNTLYNDLHTQQLEIQMMSSGKTTKPQVLTQSFNQSLKRQLREERASVKSLTEKLESIQKSIRLTSQKEMNLQLQMYQEECIRLRTLLEHEFQQSQSNVVALAQNHFNILSITSEEDRRKIINQFAKKDNDLQEAQLKIEEFKNQVKQLQGKLSVSLKYKSQNDLSIRQASLIKSKGAQIKELTEQLAASTLKIANFDRVVARNIDLSKQVAELREKLSKSESLVKAIEQTQTEVIKVAVIDSPRKKTSSHLQFTQSSFARQKTKEPQRSQPTPQIQLNKQNSKQYNSKIVPKSIIQSQQIITNKTNSVSPSPVTESLKRQHTNLSKSSSLSNVKPIPLQQPKIEQPPIISNIQAQEQPVVQVPAAMTNSIPELSNFELLSQGILNFKALVEGKVQPQTQNEMIFYKNYGESIRKLNREVLKKQITGEILNKINQNRVIFTAQHTTLPQKIRACIDKWISIGVPELIICKFVLNQIVFCIKGETVDLKLLYDRVELLLNTHSDNSIVSSDIGDDLSERNHESVVDEEKWKNTTVPVKNDSREDKNKNQSSLSLSKEQLPYISQAATDRQPKIEPLHKNQKVYNQSESESESGISETENQVEEQTESGQNSITEEQMLDTAELILSQLAQKIIQNGWSVFDVFGQPDEIIRIIPEHENEKNIKVLTPQNFLGRVYQAGIQNLTQLQVACLMRVLGKPEFDDSVRYDELELLLQNFGVHKESSFFKTPSSENLQIIEDESLSQTEGNGEIIFIDDKRPNFEFQSHQRLPRSSSKKHKEVNHSSISNQEDYFDADDLSPASNNKKKLEFDVDTKAKRPSVSGENQGELETKLVRPRAKKNINNNTVSQQYQVQINSDSKYNTAGRESESTDHINQSKNIEILSPVQKSIAALHSENETPSFEPVFSQFKTDSKKLNQVAKQLQNQNLKSNVIGFKNSLDIFKDQDQIQEEASSRLIEPNQLQNDQTKDSRVLLRQQIISMEYKGLLFSMIKDILSKMSVSQLMEELEKKCYKQVIKSKTRSKETSLITKEACFEILYNKTEVRLQQADLELLQECVQLTPKFQNLYTLKCLSLLINEVDAKLKQEK